MTEYYGSERKKSIPEDTNPFIDPIEFVGTVLKRFEHNLLKIGHGASGGDLLAGSDEEEDHNSDVQSVTTNNGSNYEDEDDTVDVDTLLELNLGMQNFTVTDDSQDIHLPQIAETGPPLPQTIWRSSHAAPNNLPPIATLFDSLENGATTSSRSEATDEFRVWLVAASALTLLSAIHVCYQAILAR
ncbi:hypothetical protein K439DRAFT_1621890 [Ramaria rubella]|nr:hypothetical protein K439DRAFT_1621890 [Ramaria rubella]